MKAWVFACFLHVFGHVFLPYFAKSKANQTVIAMLNHMKYPFAACIFCGHQTTKSCPETGHVVGRWMQG